MNNIIVRRSKMLNLRFEQQKRMFEAEYKTFRSNIADLRKKAVELFELKAKFLKEPDETAIDDLYVDSLQRVSNIHIHVIKALIDSHLAASSEINNINIEITG